jgi:hypothetical protein
MHTYMYCVCLCVCVCTHAHTHTHTHTIRFEGVGHDSSSGGCDIQYLYNIYMRQVFKPFMKYFFLNFFMK